MQETKSFDVFPLFSTPTAHATIETDIPLSVIDNLEYYEYSDTSGFSSVDQNVLTRSEFKHLRFEIENLLNNYLFGLLKFTEGRIAHTRSWINFHKYGHLAPVHNHTNSMYSGVYYFTAPEKGGKLFFQRPNTDLTFVSSTIMPIIDEHNIYNSHTFGWLPKPNDVFLFPSHLHHFTEPNLSNENRYCLAFNYFLEGPMGGNTGYVNLKVLSDDTPN